MECPMKSLGFRRLGDLCSLLILNWSCCFFCSWLWPPGFMEVWCDFTWFAMGTPKTLGITKVTMGQDWSPWTPQKWLYIFLVPVWLESNHCMGDYEDIIKDNGKISNSGRIGAVRDQHHDNLCWFWFWLFHAGSTTVISMVFISQRNHLY